jgi:hemerythrin-like domain-containing protein
MPTSTTATTKRSASGARPAAKRATPTGRTAAKKAGAGGKKTSANTRRAAVAASNAGKAGRRTAARGASTGTNSERAQRRSSEPTALDLLKQDHREVEDLFARFEKTSASAHRRRQQLVGKMIEELSRHAAIEEEIFYPAARREVAAANEEVLEALEEHHVVKWTLNELEHMDPSDERYGAKVSVLIDSVRHHVEEEEKRLFTTIRRALGAPRLREIGAELAAAKASAPTRPHPQAPDTPPRNIITQSITAPFDLAAGLSEATARRVHDLVT